MSGTVSRLHLIAVAVIVLLLGIQSWQPAPSEAESTVRGEGYQAVIRRTGFGIPHVLATSIGGVGFGQGWAYAEDRFCDLADQVIKIRSQRSRWFGPGAGNSNLATDLGYLALGLTKRAESQARTLSGDPRALLDGYVAGYNAFLARTGRANVPGWCAGQAWLGPITVVDLLAYQRDIAISASGRYMLAAAALAQPPMPTRTRGSLVIGADVVADDLRRLGRQDAGSDSVPGSNGWALGADRSESRQGMLLANPHFPWQGELRFWEVQLTVPGKLNVYGAALGGVPGVQIGFNQWVAWTHTVATGYRFTMYAVDLVPDRPTWYVVDGRKEPMTSSTVTVSVDWGDGHPRPLTRTLWSTRYGPVLDLTALQPGLGWTRTRATTYRDANLDNGQIMQQWLEIGQARDVSGVRQAIARQQGIPWVNTIAADNRGDAWYADASATPNLKPATIATWRQNPLAPLNGSVSENSWVDEAGARSPGLIPFAKQPQLRRRDYVFNANDSYWLANRRHLLTGFSPLQGQEKVPVSPRTRQNVRLIDPVVAHSRANRFTLDRLGRTVLSGQALTSDLLTSSVVAACRAQGNRPVVVDGAPVVVAPACAALAQWDRRFTVASQGAVLWRETIRAVVATHPDALTEAGPLFGIGFDPDNPGVTPRGPAADPAPLLAGLARAQLRLRSLGYGPEVALGLVQHTIAGDERIAVPGANDEVGILNVVGYTSEPGTSREQVMDGGVPQPGSDLTDRGYVVNVGTSFLMVVGYTAHGPVARAVLTFGQSADSASAHFFDQTHLFGRGQLRECRFSEAAIAADPQLTVTFVGG
ncbi:penicillin acylase family protein [Kribbella sp. NBC_01505]|uniref:penicillin acylase family protein n=1 Tax=Kribbella sp. NBC_01505 TaxID=2903580 RepID=UPI00386DFA65